MEIVSSRAASMKGRRISIEIENRFTLETYAGQNSPALCYRITLPLRSGPFRMDFGYILARDEPLHITASSGSLTLREKEGRGYHYTLLHSPGAESVIS